MTICTWERECLLGEVEDGWAVLREYGCLVEDCWWALESHLAGIELDAFVVMPNHMHGIVMLESRQGEEAEGEVCTGAVEGKGEASPQRMLRPYGTRPPVARRAGR